MRTFLAILALLLLTACASTAGYSPDQDFGSQGQANGFDRVITISADAKWVNVTRDETVKFIDASSGKSFVWRFNTPAWMFDLSKVAPSGILSGRRIDAYIGNSWRENRRSQ